MTEYIITYTTKDDKEITVTTQKNSIRGAWTQAQKLAGKQFFTATVTTV